MIGFIKKLFSGTLSFLFGLFGGKKSEAKLAGSNAKGKKKSGYFMELDEDEQPSVDLTKAAKAVTDKTKELVAAAKPALAEASKTIQGNTNNKSAKAEANTNNKQAKTEATAKNQPAKAEATAKNQPAKAEANTKNQPAKAEATAKNQPAKAEANTNSKAAEVELVQTAEGVKAQPAKPVKVAASANNQTQTETTFAPKYLNPATSTNGRRRPGPNMDTFLNMARQVKTPSQSRG